MATTPSVSDVKSYDRNEKPTDDDPHYVGALAAATRILADACQRNFTVAPADAVARTFVPDPCSSVLYVGEFTSVTSVVENGTTLTVDVDFQREPVNTVDFAGFTWPYTSLRRLDGYWYTNGGRGTVVVTLKPGWSTLPDRYVEALKVLTSDLVSNREVKLGLASFGEAGLASVRMNPIVRDFIEHFRSVKSWGVA